MTRLLLLSSVAFWFVHPIGAEDGTESCPADGSGGDSCVDPSIKDTYSDVSQCEVWAKRCECDANPGFMQKSCTRSCKIYGPLCVDKEKGCKSKTTRGCASAPALWDTCAKSCSVYEIAQKKKIESGKCKRRELPGGVQDVPIDKMFGRIADEGWAAHMEPKVLSRDPWVIYFDKFLSDELIDGLMGAMDDLGGEFQESGELSTKEDKKERRRRTSDTMFCSQPKCITEDRVMNVHEVVTNLTGLPVPCHELMQIVRYKKGQFYVQHQDTSNDYGAAGHGHRIYTLFAYLSSLPEDAGGETHIPALGIKVRPKRGAAVMWPNVQANNPRKEDLRLKHEAMPVNLENRSDGEIPEKIAANIWLYGYNWRDLWKTGCMNVNAGY